MKNKEKNFISAVVYMHNAEKSVSNFLNELIKLLNENFEKSEIICVNDSSIDDTVDKIKEISKDNHGVSISILNMSYFHGIEASMNAGVDLSIGDFVFEFDSTIMDYEPEEIMKCYRHSLEGFDIVSAVPNQKKRLSSSLFYYVVYKFTKIKMTSERFCVLSRRAINRINSMNNATPYRKIIHSNCGLKKDNIEYDVKKVKNSRTRSQHKYRKQLATDSLILFTDLGYKFSAMMTLLMMFIAFVMVVYSLVIYYTGNPVAGWTTTILFMTVCFFGLFAILTIIIKYLQLLVNLVFKRKRYSFESIEKLTK